MKVSNLYHSCSYQFHDVKQYFMRLVPHSSEISCLCLMKLCSKMLQNLPYFWNKITQIACFVVFHFEQFWICNSRCPPWSMSIWARISGSTVKNPKLLQMKNEKNCLDFHTPRLWQILKHFTSRQLHQA